MFGRKWRFCMGRWECEMVLGCEGGKVKKHASI